MKCDYFDCTRSAYSKWRLVVTSTKKSVGVVCHYCTKHHHVIQNIKPTPSTRWIFLSFVEDEIPWEPE